MFPLRHLALLSTLTLLSTVSHGAATCHASPHIISGPDSCTAQNAFKSTYGHSTAQTSIADGVSSAQATASANNSAAWASANTMQTVATFTIWGENEARFPFGYADFVFVMTAAGDVQSSLRGNSQVLSRASVTGVGLAPVNLFRKRSVEDGAVTVDEQMLSQTFRIPVIFNTPVRLNFTHQSSAIATDTTKDRDASHASVASTVSVQLAGVVGNDYQPMNYAFKVAYGTPGPIAPKSRMLTMLDSSRLDHGEVPEPGSISLMGLGMLFLWRWRRREADQADQTAT